MNIEYPTAAEIHEIHDRIVVNSETTESGMRTPEAVESAIDYISEGYFGEVPETIHEKAAHLMWLIVADHPYVDGNKRTAPWSAAYLYDLNGYRLEPDDTIRTMSISHKLSLISNSEPSTKTPKDHHDVYKIIRG